jgi:alpha-tubulin suppressor-like RCC1 family protein
MRLTSRKAIAAFAASVVALGVSVVSSVAAANGAPVDQVYSWGSNSNGQLGLGTLDASATSPTVLAAGASPGDGWIMASAGYSHACAIGDDQAAYCWGTNDHGELGNGTTGTTDDSVPGAVQSTDRWADISAGGDYRNSDPNHTCGITSTDEAYCWGSNGRGQLGNGTTDDTNVPVPVDGGVTWSSISAGGNHTCGIAADGIAYCWGWNGSGQLGNGTNDDTSVPTPVAGGLRWTSLSAGQQYTCGVTTGAVGYCWGDNYDGQLGLGTAGATDDSVPAPVVATSSASSRWLSLSSGDMWTCGVTTSRAAYCWGRNYYGQLGDGTTNRGSDDSLPIAVLAPMDAHVLDVDVAVNDESSCGITTTSAYCWGYNSGSSLGNPAFTDDTSVPVPTATTWPSPGVVPQALSVGGTFSLLLVGPPAPDPTPPLPAPVTIPPSAPRSVVAAAGEGTVSLSWTAPERPGSFPVSDYQAVSSPGGHACLVSAPARSCTVEGLTNGTSYTFTVRALSGAGWSVMSEPSNAVVPHASEPASIVITGAREGSRIAVSGTTAGMGMGMGGLVTPWSAKGRGDFVAGRSVMVSVDGTFTWSRKASASTPWRVYVTADGVRSNTVRVK